MPTPFWSELEEGASLPTLTKPPVTTRQLMKYGAASNDYYEIHYDLEFAQSTGLKTVILHGMLKMAFIGEFIQSWAGDGFIRKVKVSYRGMDFPGDVITINGTIKRKYEDAGDKLVDIDVVVENQRGEKNTPGTVTVALPA